MRWFNLAFYSWSLILFLLAAISGSETVHAMGLIALTTALLDEGIILLSNRLAKEVSFK